MARDSSSLPVPLSPRISTATFAGATFSMMRQTFCMPRSTAMMPSKLCGALRRRSAPQSFEGIIAVDRGMQNVCRIIEKVAPANVAVLILGESGTGKELLSRAIHNLSGRPDKRFIAINCAAIPENLLEAELFGYEKGAFTGAAKTTPGKVEYADGGTLFLDEVGDMPLPLQAKLLRFLQNKVIERVGGRHE